MSEWWELEDEKQDDVGEQNGMFEEAGEAVGTLTGALVGVGVGFVAGLGPVGGLVGAWLGAEGGRDLGSAAGAYLDDVLADDPKPGTTPESGNFSFEEEPTNDDGSFGSFVDSADWES